MAADRMATDLAHLTDAWQPAVLQLIAITAEAGKQAGKPVGVCGEAAADPLLACVLVGMGITSLSMASAAVRPVGARLASGQHGQPRGRRRGGPRPRATRWPPATPYAGCSGPDAGLPFRRDRAVMTSVHRFRVSQRRTRSRCYDMGPPREQARNGARCGVPHRLRRSGTSSLGPRRRRTDGARPAQPGRPVTARRPRGDHGPFLSCSRHNTSLASTRADPAPARRRRAPGTTRRGAQPRRARWSPRTR